jgi:flavin-dependent dehydrogenase
MSQTLDARYDIVIIGARCSGAALAAFTARSGARVLLVDRAPLPSDLVLSTHTLHPSGGRVLERLGILTRLRAMAPSIRTLRIGRRDATLDVRFPGDDTEFCPRRLTLDGLLQGAARDAGAVVVDRTTARALSFEAGRVTGVHLEQGGRERLVQADLVVGADGRDSFVAQQVQAREYLDYDAPRALYWSYWPAPKGYGSAEGYPGMYVVNRAGVVRLAFHTENDRVLVGSAPEMQHAGAFRADPLAALQQDVAADPLLHSLVQGAPSEKVRGYLPRRYFLREPVGPGWLLLGDAGIHQDFVTGNGMSEALRQAEGAAFALLAGEAQLEHWWRERDVAALPMFLFGKLQGAPGTPSRLDALVLAHAARSPTLEARFASSMAGDLSPLEVVAPIQALAWVLGAALRGQLGLLSDFYRHARAVREIAGVLALHRKLLAGSAAGGRPRLGGPPRSAKSTAKNRHAPPRALA